MDNNTMPKFKSKKDAIKYLVENELIEKKEKSKLFEKLNNEAKEKYDIIKKLIGEFNELSNIKLEFYLKDKSKK